MSQTNNELFPYKLLSGNDIEVGKHYYAFFKRNREPININLGKLKSKEKRKGSDIFGGMESLNFDIFDFENKKNVEKLTKYYGMKEWASNNIFYEYENTAFDDLKMDDTPIKEITPRNNNIFSRFLNQKVEEKGDEA